MPAAPAHPVRIIATDIKLAHSVFALPFAVLASFMAADGANGIDWPRFAGQLALVVVAMVCARTVAMLANRILDRDIDATNPRTQGRALPSGRLALRQAVLALLVAAVLFMAVCVGFGALYGNWWPAALGVPVLGWIAAYGFFKRFTAACHLYLGSSLAISPLAAALAIDPVALTTQPALWWLALMVLLWVAGFDVIYALQDVDVDVDTGLHSIPARFGPARALLISRGLHAGAAAALFTALAVDARLGAFFGIGVAAVLVLLVVEHATVARWGTSRIALTFFTLNGVISAVLGLLGAIDIIV